MIEKILMEIIEKHVKEEEKEKVYVGQVSSELLNQFKTNKRDKKFLKEQVDSYIEYLKTKLEQEVYEKFGSKIEELEAVRDGLWDKMYTELNVDSEANYTINHKSGEVYQYVEKQDTTRH